jgi:L-2-hydroxyglutarate oxidase
VGGGVEAGPNAVLALKRAGYGKFSFSAVDALSALTYRGFWRLAFRFWRTGLGESYRSFNKAAFVKALKRLVPGVETSDLRRGGAGVRAQAVGPDGELVDDFRLEQREGMIHVLNAPSPAATASLSIGETIAAMACEQFGFP